MLLLELLLPGRPDEGGLPMLESDVRREDGPDVSASVGDGNVGEFGLLQCVKCPLKSRFGISTMNNRDY